MSERAHEVWVVDDDPSIRRALARTLSASDYRVSVYGDGAEVIERLEGGARAGCVVLDLLMPGTDGLSLQARLNELSEPPGVVFLTGHGDIPATVRAMKSGATEFLTKPVDEADLLRAVGEALARAVSAEASGQERRRVRDRLGTLTPREREVMELVVRGRLNKQIARELGTVEQTVKVHRGRVMRKMGVESVAALVTMLERYADGGVRREGGAGLHQGPIQGRVGRG